MKRVLFIGAGLASGGAEHQCAQLMNMLATEGYLVTYASFGDVSDHYFVSSQITRVQLAPGKSLMRKLLAVEFYLLFVNTDVVIAFSQRMSCLSLFPLLFRPRIKVISSERNYTIEKPDKFERILFKTGIYYRATYIVPNNYSQAKYLSDKHPSVAKKIKVITNYTDVETYKYSPLPNNKIIKIGVFCRFEYQKNFHRFIELLYRLRALKTPAFHVDWYGNHSFKNTNQIEYYQKGIERISRLGVDDLITIYNPTNEVANLIPTYDVLCLPSLFEGFSNSLAEYICCGRPVLCSRVSDNELMVRDGINGFLFNPYDVNDMCRAFSAFLSSSQEEKIEMSINSRVIAEELFDKQRFIHSYIDLIEN